MFLVLGLILSLTACSNNVSPAEATATAEKQSAITTTNADYFAEVTRAFAEIGVEATPMPPYEAEFYFDAVEISVQNCIGEELAIGEVMPYSNPITIGEKSISYQRNEQMYEKQYPVMLWISKEDVWYEMTICRDSYGLPEPIIRYTLEEDLDAMNPNDVELPIEAKLLGYNPNTTIVRFETAGGLLEESPVVLKFGSEYATFDQYRKDINIWEEAINTEGILFDNCFVVGADLPNGINYYTSGRYLRGQWQDFCFDLALIDGSGVWHIYDFGEFRQDPYTGSWNSMQSGEYYEGYAHMEWGSLFLTSQPRNLERDLKAVELGTIVYEDFEHDLTGKPMEACLEAKRFWLRAGLDVDEVINACGEMSFQYRWQVWDWTDDYDHWTDEDPSDNTLIGVALVQLPVPIGPWPPTIPDSYTYDLQEGWIQYETPSGSRFKASFESSNYLFIGPEQCWDHVEFIPNFKCNWSEITQYQVP